MGLNRAYREQFDEHGMERMDRPVSDDGLKLPIVAAADFRDVMTAEMARMHADMDAEDARRNDEDVSLGARVIDRLRPFDHIFETTIREAISPEAGEMLRALVTAHHTRVMQRRIDRETAVTAAVLDLAAKRREVSHA